MTKQLLVLYTFLCALFVSACASIPNTSLTQATNSTGKYFQIRHPVNEVVGIQLTFLNEKACQDMKAIAAYERKKENSEESKNLEKSFSRLVSCSNASASQSLPYRATIRNKVYGFLLDIETISLQECITFLDQMITEGKEALEIVSACKAKQPTAGDTSRNGRFIADNNGTVLDTQTNLMWAAKDNGSDINWAAAKSYCENYRGAGYTDWRTPTQDELVGLYDARKPQKVECGSSYNHVATDLIHFTCFLAWASETRGSDAALFRFTFGDRIWNLQSRDGDCRALPVRSGK